MHTKTKEALNRFFISFLRAILIFLAVYLFQLCCRLPIQELGAEAGQRGVACWNLLIAALSFCSVTRIFRVNDRRACARTVARGRVSENFFRNFAYTFVSLDFWTDTVVFHLLSFVIGALPLYTHIKIACFYAEHIDSFAATVIIPLIAHAVLFFLRMIAYCRVKRAWARAAKIADYYTRTKKKRKSARIREKAKKTEVGAIAFDLFIAFVCYWGAPAVMAIPSLVIAPLIVLFGEYPSVLVGVLVAVALFLGIRYGIAIKKRRAFLRNLTRVCKEKGIPLSPIKRPYRSLFREMDGESFSLTYKGEVYHCKLLGSLSRATPYLFSEEGYVIRRRRISFGRRVRITLFNIDKRIDFHFETDGKKAIIVLPVPRELYLTNEIGMQSPIDTGDRVGDYRVYNASGFLGALERDFLGRH